MQRETVVILERALEDVQDVLFDLYALDNPEGENQLVAVDESKIKKLLELIINGKLDLILF